VRSYQDLRSEVAALGRKVAENAALRSEKESLESVLQAAHVKLAAFQEQRQALEARLSESTSRFNSLLDVERAQRRAAEKAKEEDRIKLNDALGEFADLKERLAAAMSRVSQLEGYIDRVREEDHAAPRVIPPPSRFVPRGLQEEGGQTMGVADRPWLQKDRDISPGRSRHWTDYGQHN
jgi:chromosome segregation ATPase